MASERENEKTFNPFSLFSRVLIRTATFSAAAQSVSQSVRLCAAVCTVQCTPDIFQPLCFCLPSPFLPSLPPFSCPSEGQPKAAFISCLATLALIRRPAIDRDQRPADAPHKHRFQSAFPHQRPLAVSSLWASCLANPSFADNARRVAPSPEGTEPGGISQRALPLPS